MKKIIEKDSENHILKFFMNKNWQPLDFQIEAWESYFRGESGIIQVPTGYGKTYAALMGPLLKLKEHKSSKGINILLVTPLRP